MTALVEAVHMSATHSMGKTVQPSIELLAGHGIRGDAHAGPTVMSRSRFARGRTKPNLRQVHLIHGELHDELRRCGFDVASGTMGENITTRGVDLLALPLGTRLYLGPDALVELTGLRNPCKRLNGVEAGLMNAVLVRAESGTFVRKAGVMAIVIAGGLVQDGDSVRVELPTLPHRNLRPV